MPGWRTLQASGQVRRALGRVFTWLLAGLQDAPSGWRHPPDAAPPPAPSRSPSPAGGNLTVVSALPAVLRSPYSVAVGKNQPALAAQ